MVFAGNRIFAAVAPPRAHRQLLLGLLDVPVPADACLYVRDTPWPLGHEVEVYLDTGDLISFQPATHGLIVPYNSGRSASGQRPPAIGCDSSKTDPERQRSDMALA